MIAENPMEEVWRIREKISAECGHDLKGLAARMKRLEPEYADRLARLPIRRRSQPEAADALLLGHRSPAGAPSP